jgi:hypothetical protein
MDPTRRLRQCSEETCVAIGYRVAGKRWRWSLATGKRPGYCTSSELSAKVSLQGTVQSGGSSDPDNCVARLIRSRLTRPVGGTGAGEDRQAAGLSCDYWVRTSYFPEHGNESQSPVPGLGVYTPCERRAACWRMGHADPAAELCVLLGLAVTWGWLLPDCTLQPRSKVK